MSFGQDEREEKLTHETFHDGQPTGVKFAEPDRIAIKARIVAAGIARWSVPSDAPGVDLTGRLTIINWVTPEPSSAEHAAAARQVGDLIGAI